MDLVQVLIDYRQWYADTLKTYLGRREVGTSNKGRDIDQFFNGCSVGPGHAWCACFANYGLISIGGQGPEGSAWSPSWFPDSKVVYRRGQSDARDRLETGWVFGIYFSNLKRVAHVGVIVEDLRDGYVVTVEGNTNGMGSREGHGVFLKIRHKDEIFVCSDWIN